MVNRTVRRFTMDETNIYTIKDGFITKKSVFDFIDEEKSPYLSLIKLKRNQGWCVSGKCLMFLDDEDRVMRVDADKVIEMMTDTTTIVDKSNQDSMIVLSYDSDKWTDEVLGYEFYSRGDTRKECVVKRLDVPAASEKDGFTKCVFIKDKYAIYTVIEENIYKESIFSYIINHGIGWQDNLVDNRVNSGFVMNEKGVFVRLIYDRADRIKEYVWEQIMNDTDTTIWTRSSVDHAYVILEYNNKTFPDSMILAE